jgi:hypothetical protein
MTSEDREDIKRYFGVVVEGLRTEIQQVAEGVTANGEALDRFRDETTRELVAVRSDANAFRAETARSFAAVHTEITAVRSEAEAFRGETARNFAEVRSEAEAFRGETARNFAAVRAELVDSRAGIPLPRRPRTRRRPN